MSEPTTPTTPAGWYPDPSDPSRSRWWDGYQWNEATAPLQAHGFTGVPVIAESAPPVEPALRVESAPPVEPAAPVAPAPPGEQPSAVTSYPDVPAVPTYPGSPAVPAYPGADGSPMGAYPSTDSVAPSPRVSASPNTAWFWLVVLLPYLPAVIALFIDWKPFVAAFGEVASAVTISEELNARLGAMAMGFTVIMSLAFLAAGLAILFAFLDANELRKRGIVRPFHAGFSIFVMLSFLTVGSPFLIGVYVIGRAVVVRRQTGKGMAPLWVWIALTVVIGVATVVVAAVLLAQFSAILESSYGF